MVPPTLFSHPVCSSSAGVQFQSPPTIQGPTTLLRVKATELSRSRLFFALMPPLPTSLKQYIEPKWMPPLPMAAILFMPKWPLGCRCWDAVTALEDDMPM